MSRRVNRFFLFVVLIILPLCGVWQTGQGAWIHAKAHLAQLLLEAAWSETLRTGREVKPWPWADTWPVARLSVPRLGIRRIVLAGASGSSLAFGPGHFFSSARPGTPGNSVIAGHRDTHFRFLQKIRRGDVIIVETADHRNVHFQVTNTGIVHRDNTQALAYDPGTVLTLITCYPFDAITTGGPLRYVVSSRAPASAEKML